MMGSNGAAAIASIDHHLRHSTFFSVGPLRPYLDCSSWILRYVCVLPGALATSLIVVVRRLRSVKHDQPVVLDFRAVQPQGLMACLPVVIC